MYVNTTTPTPHLTLCVCVAEGVGEVYFYWVVLGA